MRRSSLLALVGVIALVGLVVLLIVGPFAERRDSSSSDGAGTKTTRAVDPVIKREARKRDFTLHSAGYSPVVSDGHRLYVAGYYTFYGLEELPGTK
jgi:hypothetical protein